MLTLLSYILNTIFYLAILIFIVGSIYVVGKWIFIPKGKTGTYFGFHNLFDYPGQTTRMKAFENILGRMFLFTSAKRDPYIRWLSLSFHWSLWIIILAHLDLVTSSYFVSIGIPESLLSDLGAYLGTTLAFVMVISGLLLVARRIKDPYLRRLSTVGDYFAILLVVAIGISGIYMRFVLPPLFAYQSVSPWIFSLASLTPLNFPYELPFIAHILLVSTLLIYFPFSKFLHPYSFFTNPNLHAVYEKVPVDSSISGSGVK
jgi:nitrate reductase gamma subunit